MTARASRPAARWAALLATVVATWLPSASRADAPAPAPGGDCMPAGNGPLRMNGSDLVLHGADGAPQARWLLRDADGHSGTLLATCQLAQRRSLVVVVQGWHELWEISTDPAAPPLYDGLVHDWRLGEGIARPGHLGVRRIRLQRPWVAVWADGRVPWLLGAEEPGGPDGGAVVLHLDVRRTVGRLPWPAAGGWPAVAGQRFPWGPGPAAP